MSPNHHPGDDLLIAAEDADLDYDFTDTGYIRIVDHFAGSGSTMAAAEQLGRRSLLMEIDPLYCDVIVERWQRLTDKEPTLEDTGQTFSQVAYERGISIVKEGE